ncbi:DUF4129 domain-containing protein [Thiocystis violacea]|uniref:DUF4129 domain-containing protein n=1 Tax=Thiocystis violacea TaxID=13725 RepID=UPI0019069AAD|nr:DUF4129 domain-containing protein [Thiocystis violacea]
MELDRATASLRPRDPWEGQDLGFALARAWFLPMWLLWWVSALPLGVLCLFLTGPRPGLWLLALWWLKPIYEGPLLVWASRALFGERLGWRALGPLLRDGLPRRMLPHLLWRRISMRRSFLMPLTLLEGLQGSALRQRRHVMSNGSGVPFWVTLTCYHFEILIWAGILLGVFFLVPQGVPRLDLLAAVTDETSWAYWVSVIGYAFAFSLIAPFYVCAGFALYLARRTELEAWDLELAFKQARAASPGANRAPTRGRDDAARFGAGLAVATLVLGLSLLPAGMATADARTEPDQARALIAEILADPAFGSLKERQEWVPISTPAQEEEPASLPRGVKAILLAVATSLKWLLLALAVVAIALLGVRVWRDRGRFGWTARRARPDRSPAPPSLESIADAGLPEDIAGAVRSRLTEGDRRGALSLLYRASLAHLIRLGVEIPDGATEGECLALASRRLSPARLGPFALVTRAWQRFAYAHRLPTDEALEALLDTWSRWTADAETVTT